MPKLKGVELDEKVHELRRRGHTFLEIGHELEVGTTTAWRAYHRQIRRSPESATVEEARELELERLDGMLRAMYAKAEAGDHLAVDRVLKISQRRAKLLGLDLVSPSSTRIPDGEEREGAAGVSQIEDFRRRREELRGGLSS